MYEKKKTKNMVENIKLHLLPVNKSTIFCYIKIFLSQ